MKGLKNEKFDDTSENRKRLQSREALNRKAFRNVCKPGANEHYFLHMMRNHPDFIPPPAFVLEMDGEIIGNMMYTRA